MGKRGPKPRDNISRKVCSFRLSEEEKVMTQIFSTLIHEPQRKRILKQVLLMLLQPVKADSILLIHTEAKKK